MPVSVFDEDSSFEGSASPLHRLDEATRAIASASAEALAAVADFDDEKRWRHDGSTSMTSWLAARYGFSWGTAREWVRVARALRSLPAIARAFARGELSWDQVRSLTKFVTPECDAEWARRAGCMSPAAPEREASRHQKLTEREVTDLHRLRRLSMWWDEERPLMYFEGTLASDQGAAFKEVLERRAQKIMISDDPVWGSQEARLADALVELVCETKEGDPAPATMVVHADASILAGHDGETGPWLAETISGTRLASETVRRLACDARVEWMLEREGRPVGIGRRGRTVPSAVMRALRFRDCGCRFPGCNRRAFVQAHHVVHWANGGGTDLDNLVLLCHAHHRLVHEEGWRISGHPGKDLRFHDPRGRPVHARSP
ncbi:MAG TPA: DUF222 domain-containing protein [Actinomycetota bacterium]|nr:DUF222 domain-containing protein [Actinomycetota bacterium]